MRLCTSQFNAMCLYAWCNKDKKTCLCLVQLIIYRVSFHFIDFGLFMSHSTLHEKQITEFPLIHIVNAPAAAGYHYNEKYNLYIFLLLTNIIIYAINVCKCTLIAYRVHMNHKYLIKTTKCLDNIISSAMTYCIYGWGITNNIKHYKLY